MSGWIKLEKDLLTDPRVIRMGAKLCNGLPLQGVTVVLGGLAHLWMLADTHISQDDIIPLGIDEINHVIGIQGFCEALPQDWLQVIDSDSVKLPGFHEHNGTIAKERAGVAKRVEKHRAKRNAQALHDVTEKRYQTKTKTYTKKEEETPPILHASLPRKEWDEWLNWRRTKRMPCDALTLSKQLEVLAKLPVDQQIATINKSIQANWQGLFPEKVNGRVVSAPNLDLAWTAAKARAQAIGFRDPWPQESPSAYLTQIKFAESSPPRRAVDTTHLTAKMRIAQ